MSNEKTVGSRDPSFLTCLLMSIMARRAHCLILYWYFNDTFLADFPLTYDGLVGNALIVTRDVCAASARDFSLTHQRVNPGVVLPKVGDQRRFKKTVVLDDGVLVCHDKLDDCMQYR